MSSRSKRSSSISLLREYCASKGHPEASLRQQVDKKKKKQEKPDEITVVAMLAGKIYGSGTAGQFKQAAEKAAEEALASLRQADDQSQGTGHGKDEGQSSSVKERALKLWDKAFDAAKDDRAGNLWALAFEAAQRSIEQGVAPMDTSHKRKMRPFAKAGDDFAAPSSISDSDDDAEDLGGFRQPAALARFLHTGEGSAATTTIEKGIEVEVSSGKARAKKAQKRS